MKRSALAIRIGRIVGLLVLLALVAASLGLPFPLRSVGGQQPRPTPTSGPSVMLSPTEGVAWDATDVEATGVFWTPGGTVILYWDGTLEVGLAAVASDGTFQTSFTTPTGLGYGSPGLHFVLAVQGGFQSDAQFLLIPPTPTDTPTPTNTPRATDTPTPVTPTDTPAPTDRDSRAHVEACNADRDRYGDPLGASANACAHQVPASHQHEPSQAPDSHQAAGAHQDTAPDGHIHLYPESDAHRHADPHAYCHGHRHADADSHTHAD
ncbi:MAG: hypothetical protein P8189_23655 [Anaerolineae bacterium]